jgi:hypothetical protein
MSVFDSGSVKICDGGVAVLFIFLSVERGFGVVVRVVLMVRGNGMVQCS